MENNAGINETVSPKNAVQRDVVASARVPAGRVLVVTWHGQNSWEGKVFRAYSAGEEVTKKDLRMGTIINDGQSATFIVARSGRHGAVNSSKRVFNRAGKAIVEDDLAPGKKFAQEQRAWLREKGFDEKEIDILMRVARPGQVRAAVEWAIIAKQRWQQETPELRERQIEVTLAEAVRLSMGRYGWGKTIGAIEEMTGVYAPEAANAREFFGIVQGAQAVLEMGLPVAAA